MLNLNFVVSPTHLAWTLLNPDPGRNCSEQAEADIEAFQRSVFESGRYGHSGYGPMLSGLEMEDILREPALEPLLEETRAGAVVLEQEWQAHYSQTSEWMRRWTGMDLSGNFIVLLTHPKRKSGRYRGAREIEWSAGPREHHANIYYLWHEVLHAFFPKGKRAHALIELITDNHLRCALNGLDYPPLQGHPSLNEQRLALLPAWRAHLENGGKVLDLLN
jgi:hypothetical protein